MQKKIVVAVAAALTAFAMAGASAKPLVYCSEGFARKLHPRAEHTGTSFDAARRIYNKSH